MTDAIQEEMRDESALNHLMKGDTYQREDSNMGQPIQPSELTPDDKYFTYNNPMLIKEEQMLQQQSQFPSTLVTKRGAPATTTSRQQPAYS